MKFSLVAIIALVVTSNSESIRSRATTTFIREESDQPMDGNPEMTTMGERVTFLQMQRAHDKVLLQMEAQTLLQQQHASFAALHPQEFLQLQGWFHDKLNQMSTLAKEAANDAVTFATSQASRVVKKAAKAAYTIAAEFRCTPTGLTLCKNAVKYVSEKGQTVGAEKCLEMSEKVCSNKVIPIVMRLMCPYTVGPMCIKAVAAGGGRFNEGLCGVGCGDDEAGLDEIDKLD